MKFEPGIYPNVPMSEYLAMEGWNSSSIKWSKVSMLHAKAARDGRIKFASKATALGTLCHARLLEPDALMDQYVEEPPASDFPNKDGSVSKSFRGNKAYEKWAAQQSKIILLPEDNARSKVIVDSIHNCPEAMEMFAPDDPGAQNECVILWIDPHTGVKCKARVDRLLQAWLLDLKTTRRLGRVFENQLSTLDYPLSLAFYRRGCAQADGIVRQVGIIAAETDEPYDVQAAPFNNADLDKADDRISIYLSQIAECEASGVWPGRGNPGEWKAAEWVNNLDDPNYDGVDLGDDPSEEEDVKW